MTTALQITVLVVLCFGIPLAFLAMIRAHARADANAFKEQATLPPLTHFQVGLLDIIREYDPMRAKKYDPDYIAAQLAKAAPAFADDEEDNQPVVRKFNKEGANVPPSGLHNPERAADLKAISAEILEVIL